jgi:hypothetical protein
MWQKLEYLGMTITKIIFMMKIKQNKFRECFLPFYAESFNSLSPSYKVNINKLSFYTVPLYCKSVELGPLP